MAADMHDLKYGILAMWALQNWGQVLKNVRSEVLNPVAGPFLANLDRTSIFCFMPAHLAQLARRDQLWTDYTTQQKGGSINPDSREYPHGLSAEDIKIIQPFLD